MYSIHVYACKAKPQVNTMIGLIVIHVLINPRHACTGGLRYLSCVCVCVCVSVCYHSSGNIGRFYTENEVRRGLS